MLKKIIYNKNKFNILSYYSIHLYSTINNNNNLYNKTGPLNAYIKLSEKNEISFDKFQYNALTKLQNIYEQLITYTPPQYNQINDQNAQQNQLNIFSSISNIFNNNKIKKNKNIENNNNNNNNNIKGMYLWGGPGSGKTFLMDLFYNQLDEYKQYPWDHINKKFHIKRKRRIHFNEFMLDIHDRLHKLNLKKKLNSNEKINLLKEIVNDLLNDAYILCFDEFQVTDIADAMIMKKLFQYMIENGAIIIATSNRLPNELYKNGIQRDLFIPFIKFLEDHLIIHSMVDSPIDYRFLRSQIKAEDSFFSPINNINKNKFNNIFNNLIISTEKILWRIKGRDIILNEVDLSNKIARSSFDDLCRTNSGAEDYICFAKHINTLFIYDIPKLTLNDINLIRRFIILIDVLYENKVKIILLSDFSPENILDINNKNNLSDKYDEIFAFDRTISRLLEMQSKEYVNEKNKENGKEKILPLLLDKNLINNNNLIKNIFLHYDINEENKWNFIKFKYFLNDFLSLKDMLINKKNQDNNNKFIINMDQIRDYWQLMGGTLIHNNNNNNNNNNLMPNDFIEYEHFKNWIQFEIKNHI